MKRILTLRGNKISEVLEVTGKDLEALNGNYSFISISEHDMNTVDFKSDEVVGVIAGDINSIDEVWDGVNEQLQNPDCWFINKEFFDKNYVNLEDPETRFSFGDAITLLKAGYKVARIGWNGKGMYLRLITKKMLHSCQCQFELKRYFPDIIKRDENDYRDSGHVKVDEVIAMRTALGTIQPGWLASQADILAEDWVLVK